MLYTLDQARAAVRRFVDSGSCTLATIDARINEALERLTDNADFECMRAVVRISVCDLSFTLPYNVEKILMVTLDGTPAHIFNQPYQFLSSGPGDLDMRGVGGSGCGCSSGCTSGSCIPWNDLLDQGEFPTMFDVPKCYTWPVAGVDTEVDVSETGMQLMAFSSAAEDAGKKLRVRGYNGIKEMVGASVGAQGEEITIHAWDNGLEGSLSGWWGVNLNPSVNRFTDVTGIVKPETAGYVSLFAVAGSNSIAAPLAYFSFLGKYHPRQTVPAFRRYALTSKDTTSTCATNVLALVRLRPVPLVDGTDILYIDSMQALKLMVMAITEENKGNLQGALNFESQAVAVMQKRERARLQAAGAPVILNVDYRLSTGRYLNRGGLIL